MGFFHIPPSSRQLVQVKAVKLEQELESEFHDSKGHITVLAEIAGSEKASEAAFLVKVTGSTNTPNDRKSWRLHQ
jgi:hypothetical protein